MTSGEWIPRDVFVTGGTGYMGGRLIAQLVARGHRVRALARAGSEQKLPPGCTCISGDPLVGASYSSHVRPGDTFVQLVGVPHPAPHKAAQFKAIDRVAGLESVQAARERGVAHIVYVSVAQPAPVMKVFIDVRAEVERAIGASGIPASILRPWYVLGRGHRWPLFMVPVYWLLERIPSTAEAARRLGLVTLDQMIAALVDAVEYPPTLVRIIDVPAIRATRLRR
jgi:uncharacterized protein YbjT (DUF2867 family)